MDIDLNLDFEWTDGTCSCLCCDEYELNISENSLDTLRFRFKHTYSHQEAVANPDSDEINDDNNYNMQVNIDENVYTRANMRNVISEIRDMYIDNKNVRDRMFAFFIFYLI